MKKNLKIFYLFLTLTCLTNCSCKRINRLQDVKDSIEIGNELVENIKKYKSKYGEYPNKLNDLVPEFYNEIPKTSMKQIENNNIVYRNYRYVFYKEYSKMVRYIAFNASLREYSCNSIARDTCSKNFIYQFDLSLDDIGDYEGMYKNWIYFSYNNCNDEKDTPECIFKKELKCEYEQVEVKVK